MPIIGRQLDKFVNIIGEKQKIYIAWVNFVKKIFRFDVSVFVQCYKVRIKMDIFTAKNSIPRGEENVRYYSSFGKQYRHTLDMPLVKTKTF